jgi:DNA-binding GntR family transcriptional regulator
MDYTTLDKVKRESVSQKIYEKLKDRILNGEVPSGAHLYETKLAAQLGTSRGPIREALRQLEADGLVEVRTNIGTFVHKLTAEEVIEIYTVRSLLEGYTVKLAADKATRVKVEKLQQIIQAANQAAKDGDLQEPVRYDFDLHRHIWEMADHKILYDLLHHLEWRVRMLITLQAPLFTELVDSIQDHALIVDAIAEGDGEKASDLIQEHIREAGALIIESMNKTE